MKVLIKGINSNFKKLVIELEKARSKDVPTYAPNNFNKCLEYYKQAKWKFANYKDLDEINRDLELALETLKIARLTAKKSNELLFEIVEKRNEINKNEKIRSRFPKKINEAEKNYRKAILLAEEDEFERASKFAVIALNLYQNAKLSALEGEHIKNLKNQLFQTKEILDPAIYEKGLSILSSITKDLKDAQTGNFDGSHLNAKIVIASGKIDSILRLNTGFGLDNYSVDLHDRVFYPPQPPGLAPGTNEPPTPPTYIRIVDRTVNTIAITWRNIISQADANVVLRREDDGPWENIAELDVLSEWQSYTDTTNLQPDRLYCYRIRVRNEFGPRTSSIGNQACGYTRDGNDLTVSRAQLRIRLADITNAGSDDSISVRLNSPLSVYSPWGNNTWLDYGPDYNMIGMNLQISDDFDRGREFTYDLNLSSLSELSDINMISIKKEGTNDIAIAELALLVNGVLVFDKFFGETASTAEWVEEYFTINHGELRAHNNWPTSFPFPSFQISNQELVERLEGIIGHEIHGTNLYWGGFHDADWIEVSYANDSTLHVDVVLKAEVIGLNPDAKIEFDFNIAIACSDTSASLMITTSNLKIDVDFSLLADILSFGIVEAFDDNIKRAIRAGWPAIEETIDFSTGGICPIVEVDQEGNLNFRLG